MNPSYAMIPGSFDPPTNGHLDIIERISALYEKVYVVIAYNESKQGLFTVSERKSMLEKAVAHLKNVEVDVCSGLTVDFASQHNIGVMVRGVRALTDFAYEFELAETNKELCPQIEVLFIPANPKFFLLRSSTVKELAHYGAEIESMVPHTVAEELKKKMAN